MASEVKVSFCAGMALQKSLIAARWVQGYRNISALAKELDAARRLLYQWQMRLDGPVAPIAPRYPGLEEESRQLKQLLAVRTLEVDFFKGALQR